MFERIRFILSYTRKRQQIFLVLCWLCLVKNKNSFYWKPRIQAKVLERNYIKKKENYVDKDCQEQILLTATRHNDSWKETQWAAGLRGQYDARKIMEDPSSFDRSFIALLPLGLTKKNLDDKMISLNELKCRLTKMAK